MKYFVFGVTAIFLALCSKEVQLKQSPPDYLIFGHFYNFCLGDDCIEIFKLTEEGLFEDISDSYLANQFEFVPLDAEKSKVARGLRQALPAPLLQSPEASFGCPDCADQGGLYIEISSNGERQSWRIDQDKRMVPGYLHSFMDQVNQTISALQ